MCLRFGCRRCALTEAFLNEFGRSLGRPPGGLSRDAQRALVDYHWPGNVRELRNVLERAAILCDGGLITADHLALQPRAHLASPSPLTVMSTPAAAPEPAAAPSDLNAIERAMIEKVLNDVRFNKSQAAKVLGLTRAQLYVRLRKHGLE